MTNFRSDARGLQGSDGEIFLDLEEDLPPALAGSFDVVFNHTTLEHVFEVRKAFANLCSMSRDVVILVVPFLQPMHADYGDFWRFTPLALKRMFEEAGMSLVYSSFNRNWLSAVYLFAVASRNLERWSGRIGNEFSFADLRWAWDGLEPWVGSRSIPNLPFALLRSARRVTRRRER